MGFGSFLRMVSRAACLPALLLLGACTDSDWDSLTSFPTASAAAPSPMPAATRSVDETAVTACARAAKARSGDVAFQGFSDEIQQAVYDKTYADCLGLNQHMTARRDGS